MIRTLLFSAIALVGTAASAQHIFGLPDACTYYGSLDADFARAMAIDGNGDVYIAGNTNSANLPGTGISAGGWDVFVAKFDATLENLLAATLIGGGGTDLVYDLAIDSSGSIIIAGRTSSADFPLTAGAYKSILTSPAEAFIAKLNGALTVIESSTLVGPTITDDVYGKVSLVIDPSQNIYVASNTEDSTYPVTTGAFDEDFNTGADAVISKLSNDLTTLMASTFLGDSMNDYALALAFNNGDLFVGGRTTSPNFPVTTSDTLRGASDAFISILSDDLQLLPKSRFFGGVKSDEITTVVPDGSGGVFVAGNTFSDTLFNGGFQDSLGGSQDGFVLRFNSALSIQSNTYLGGLSNDGINAMILGDDGLLYLCGQTTSNDFPKTWQGFDQVYQSEEGFISALSNDLSTLVAGGYLGGNHAERAYDLGQSGIYLYFTGWTQSDTFWQTASAYDTLWNGSSDAFVLRTGSLASPVELVEQIDFDAEIRGDNLWVILSESTIVSVALYSADGRLVWSQTSVTLAKGDHDFKLPEVVPGAYVVSVRTQKSQTGLKYVR